jgi:Tfp pilus assembly protein PilF
MTANRSVLFTVLVALFVPSAPSWGAAVLASPAAPYRAPYLPTSEDEPLQEVPAISDPSVTEMRRLRAKLDAAPQNLPAAIELANTYIDYSRQIGDAHYAGYAEAVIAPWISLAAPPPVALLTQATILQYRHQFAGARELLQKALHKDPRNGQAWLTLATLDLVQGDYPMVTRNCAQVSNNAGAEFGLGCLANLRAYTGQAQQSLVLLQQALTLARKASPGFQAWIHGLMAEGAERLGDWPLVEMHYRQALKFLPQDNYLLVAYADFLLDRGRPKEILPLLADHTQSDTAFLRLALAELALRTPDAARYTWIMAARFEALKSRGSDYFGREESRFALQLEHDAPTALSLARRNWQLQRAPWDARVLLEAALAAHQPHAATEVLEFLKQTSLQDPIVSSLAQQVSAQLLDSGQSP